MERARIGTSRAGPHGGALSSTLLHMDMTRMDSSPCPATCSATCPLCGGPNGCALAQDGGAPQAGEPFACWCQEVTPPAALQTRLRARQPDATAAPSCVCRACIAQPAGEPPAA